MRQMGIQTCLIVLDRNCLAERHVCVILMSTDVHIHAPQMFIWGRLGELGLSSNIATCFNIHASCGIGYSFKGRRSGHSGPAAGWANINPEGFAE